MFARTLASATLALLVMSPAFADDMSAMNMTPTASDSPSTQAFKAGMAKMDTGMGHYTGDADRDFVVNMIPHHQGAIDMANTELKYGKDSELRTLAKNIITAQEQEISMMQDWLKNHPQ